MWTPVTNRSTAALKRPVFRHTSVVLALRAGTTLLHSRSFLYRFASPRTPVADFATEDDPGQLSANRICSDDDPIAAHRPIDDPQGQLCDQRYQHSLERSAVDPRGHAFRTCGT